MKNIVAESIFNVIDGMKVPNTERAMISIMMHSVVFDLQKAIFDLVNSGNFTSASALLRVMFEAHVKGVWIYSCASDKQIVQFKKDALKSSRNPKNKLDFGEMVDDIERAKPYLDGRLSEFKVQHWKGLNSLTHSGVLQCGYSFVNGEMKKAFSESYHKTMLDFANRFSIVSLGDVGKITSDAKILRTTVQLFNEYADLEQKIE